MLPKPDEPSSIFVSYAHADQAFVARLLVDLAERGVSCWLDSQALPPGTPDWEQAVREALRACRVVLLIASPDSRQSRYVKAELSVAELYERPVYPLWVAGDAWIESIPLGLSTAQYVDARGERYGQGLAEIVAALSAAPAPSGGAGASPPTIASALCDAVSRHNLPAALSSLIGREREQSEVRALLAQERLVTLVGAGGVGKTRLTLAVAGELVDQYADGVWLVELAALVDPALVAVAVAQALGRREEPNRPILATLTDYLKDKQLLLVLDNCEHLVATCAVLVGALLRGCSRLRVLATSREGLQVTGEHRYRVPSLSVPDPAHLPPTEVVGNYEAVRLFVARAQAGRRDFMLDEQTGQAVAAVCARLDGIPLAIELAAARVGSLPVTAIAARLDQSMRLLTGGPRDALPRQQTLRATLDWSWDLLGAPEQALLRRLSVFAGGWTLEAAEVTCAGEGVEPEAVVDLLAALVGKSLALLPAAPASHPSPWSGLPAGETRYRLLEPVRQYAAEALLGAGEAAPVEERHLDWCLTLAEEAEAFLYGPNQRLWLVRLEAEHDNLRAALGRRLAAEGAALKQLQLATVLDVFWRMHGYMGEGRRWQEEALAHPATRGAQALRARALAQVGFLAGRQGDFAGAGAFLEESETISRAVDDQSTLAQALQSLGEVAMLRGDYPRASTRLAESLVLFRALGDTLGIAQTLGKLGSVAMFRGDYDRAWALHEEGLALRRAQGSIFSIAFALAQLGQVAYQRGDLERMVAVQVESLLLSRGIDARIPVSISLEGLAWVAGARGQAERAARLGGAAEVVREALGSPVQAEERAGHDQAIQAMRAALGEEAFAAAWADGRALPLDVAIAEALEGSSAG